MLNRYRTSFFASLPLTLLYGLITRFVFQSDVSSNILGVLTIGLILFGPFAVGALTVFFSPRSTKLPGRSRSLCRGPRAPPLWW